MKIAYAMEPALPRRGDLEELAVEVLKSAATLHERLPEATRAGVADMLRLVNCYYSNRIEGHHTHPRDIERAVKDVYAEDPALRALQREARAHVEVEKLAEERLRVDPNVEVWTAPFLRWLHREFFTRVPEELRIVRDPVTGREEPVVPGEIRNHDSQVGLHFPPSPAEIEGFLDRFATVYDTRRLSAIDRVLAFAASHHRLMWIHPFADGNGRVTRLFTTLYARYCGIEGTGLWSPSRGLARNRDAYIDALADADSERYHDSDGRGALSLEALTRFSTTFLEICLDQITYMRRVLSLEALGDRLVAYGELRASGLAPEPTWDHDQEPSWARYPFRKESGLLLRELMLRGEVARGEAGRIVGRSASFAREVVARLEGEGLIVSRSPKGPIRLGFPAHAVEYWFPDLYGPAAHY